MRGLRALTSAWGWKRSIKRSSARAKLRRAACSVEGLESRTLLAVTAFFNFNSRTLTVTLGDVNDTATLTGTSAAGNLIQLAGTGFNTLSFGFVNAIQVVDGGANAGQSVALTSSGMNQINLPGGINISGIETVTLSTSTILQAASFAEAGASSGVQLNTVGVTTNGPMSFGDTITLGANTTLDTTGGGATPAGAGLALAAISGASQNLNLNAGTGGGISFGGAVTNVASLTATGGGITVGAAITAPTTGTVSLTSTSGILVNAGITTTNGNLTLSANQQSTPTSGNFIAVNISGAKVQSTGTGVVSVSGRGGDDGSGSQIGVSISGAGATITSGGGNVMVSGQGGGSGSGGSNYGVSVQTSISAGASGNVTVIGTGGANDNGNSDIGVILAGLGATITSGGGNVSVTGQGGGTGSGSFNFGVAVGGGSSITARGTGSVTVTGTGGATAGGSDDGVVVAGNGTRATITSAGGNVSVTGQGGGSDASSTNVGVAVEGNAIITAGGTGNVTVSGSGGATSGLENYGVWLVISGAQIQSAGGNVSVTGAGGGTDSSSVDVEIDAFTTVSSGGSGNLTINANSLNVDGLGTIKAGASGNQIVAIVPRTTGTSINLGGDNAAGTLGLSNTELNRITAGTLRIGAVADTGGISVTAPVSVSNIPTLSLLTGGGVLDQNTVEPDITVASLAIQSAGGINLDTAVSNLAFANSAGFVFIRNAGAMTFGPVDGLSASFNGGTSTEISTASPINFAVNVTTGGPLTVTATDSGPTHFDNITVNPGVTLQATSGDVALQAGDDVTIGSGAAVRAIAGNVDLHAGAGDADGEGLITLNGAVSAMGTVALNVNASNASEASGTNSVSEAATGSIVAAALLLLKNPAGPDQPFALDASTSNAVGTIAGMTNGDIRFRDSIALTVGGASSSTEGITATGILSNGHDVTLTTGGNLRLSQGLSLGGGAATFTAGGAISGAGAVTAGSLSAHAVTGIGSSASPVRTQIGTVQAITGTGGIFISNSITLPLTLDVGAGGVHVTGRSGDIQITNKGTIEILTNGGTVSGPGNITVQANGSLSNVITGGQLGLSAISGLGSGVIFVRAGGDILLGDSTGYGYIQSSSGSIGLTAGGNIILNANASVTVLSGSGGVSATAGADLSMLTSTGSLPAAPTFASAGGEVDLTATGTVTADSTGADAVFSSGGNIDVTAANMTISKALDAGSGSVTLNVGSSGTAELTNLINASTVNLNAGGSLFVDGPAGTINAPVNVNAGTLGGTGTIAGAVTTLASTTLSPGHGGPGILTTGTDNLPSGSTLSVQLSGPTPGNTATSYAQLDVNGDVNLNGATLAAVLTFVPASSQSFTLIQATGTISGQFAQGSSIVLNGVTYTIAYLPNSVVLSPAPQVAASTGSPGSVGDALLTAHGRNVSSMAGSKKFNNVTVVSFTDANLLATAAAFTATINWGDGTTSTGQIIANGKGTFSVIGSHTYGHASLKKYALSIQIVADGGSTTTVTGTATLRL